jgi:hypothetical protein
MKLNRRNMIAGSAATAAMVAGGAKAAAMETYYYMVFLNPVAGRETEFNTFYDTRHIIDVTSVPGFVSGQRFIRNDPQMYSNKAPALPTYLALYTVRTDNLDAVNADIANRGKTGVTKFPTPNPLDNATYSGYWYRFNAPLIKRTMPLPADFAGKKLVNYDHIVFMNAADGKQKEWADWYDQTHSPDMLTGRGIMTAQRATLARPSGDAKIPATNQVVLFTVSIPEDMPVNLAAPEALPRPPGTPPTDMSLQKDTRGYTYRQIGPLVTHEEAVARKATFKD